VVFRFVIPRLNGNVDGGHGPIHFGVFLHGTGIDIIEQGCVSSPALQIEVSAHSKFFGQLCTTLSVVLLSLSTSCPMKACS